MATNTPNQGLPYPTADDHPADTPLFIEVLAEAVEKKLVQVFTTSADRDAKLTTPTEGMLCVLTTPAPGQVLFRDGSAWVQLYPVVSQISSGTTVPSNTLGNNGDIYLKY